MKEAMGGHGIGLLLLLVAGISVVELTSAHSQSGQEEVHSLKGFRPPTVKLSAKETARMTQGVDIRISALQDELITAQQRAHTAENTIESLKTKEETELANAKSDRLQDPKGGHLSDDDITESYGKLIQAEQDDLQTQEKTVRKVNDVLGKVEDAKRKIVKAGLGVVAIKQVQKMKAAQSKADAMEMHKAMQEHSQQQFEDWKSVEARSTMAKQSKRYEEGQAAAEKKQKEASQAEVESEVGNLGPGTANSEAGIIQRIKLQSDADISQLSEKDSDKSSKMISKWRSTRDLARKRLERLRDDMRPSKLSYFNATQLAHTNKLRQKHANAEAILALSEKKDEQGQGQSDGLPDYETEYHAYKVTHTAEHNVTEAAEMAEIAERTHNLKMWDREYEDAENKRVKDQLTRLADADRKNDQLNGIYLQANELQSKKDALAHLAKLKTETKAADESNRAANEKPLPAIPEEYKAPINPVNGKEDISRSNTVHKLNSEIEAAQQKFSKAHKAVPSDDLPGEETTLDAKPANKHIENQLNQVQKGFAAVSDAAESQGLPQA